MIIQVAAAFVATLFFAILFNVNRKELVYCGLVGSCGWLIYLLSIDMGHNTILASFLASLVLSILSHLLAIKRKNPVTVYQIAGIIPIVPGGLLYSSVFWLIQGNTVAANKSFIEALQIAGGIAIAMLFVQSVMKVFSLQTVKR